MTSSTPISPRLHHALSMHESDEEAGDGAAHEAGNGTAPTGAFEERVFARLVTYFESFADRNAQQVPYPQSTITRSLPPPPPPAL